MYTTVVEVPPVKDDAPRKEISLYIVCPDNFFFCILSFCPRFPFCWFNRWPFFGQIALIPKKIPGMTDLPIMGSRAGSIPPGPARCASTFIGRKQLPAIRINLYMHCRELPCLFCINLYRYSYFGATRNGVADYKIRSRGLQSLLGTTPTP